MPFPSLTDQVISQSELTAIFYDVLQNHNLAKGDALASEPRALFPSSSLKFDKPFLVLRH